MGHSLIAYDHIGGWHKQVNFSAISWHKQVNFSAILMLHD
jgi:hypothetical protein